LTSSCQKTEISFASTKETLRGGNVDGDMSIGYRQYTETLESRLGQLYTISERAREKGLDPSLRTECMVAKDMADLVEGLVGPKGVAQSIRELSSKLPREEIAFKVTEQIIYGKFEHLESEAAAEQAIRTALAIFTEGVTAAPIQGVAKVRIKMNSDRTRYLAIYFAQPIRSAGGTDQALTLVVGDFVRGLLGLDRYKPTEQEVSRFIEELRAYERSVTGFQYHIPDDELRKALISIPVEVTGTESDPVEVFSYRNLPRIETNRVRGGALRVVNDGIVGRASKVSNIIEKLGFQGWDWLKELRTKSEKKSAGFMDDVIAGRPVFSFPSRRGGFRLRYGRARNTGLTAVGINPATMSVLQGFLAGGTQMRMELPGKGGVVAPVDSIEGPVVRLNDGSVTRVSTESWSEMRDKIEKILFLGDVLVSFGDFLYNSQLLVPSGYVEEWWAEDLQKAIVERTNGNLEKITDTLMIPVERLRLLLGDPFANKPNIREATALSSLLNIPLHPCFTYFWSNLSSAEEVRLLKDWLLDSQVQVEGGAVREIVGRVDARTKRALELICLPHRVLGGNIVIEGDDAQAFALSLGFGHQCNLGSSSVKSVMEETSDLAGVQIREKAPTYVGARMGRPEKAKRREMKPLVHVLFPVGLAGGSQRDIVDAGKKGAISVEIVRRICPSCKTYTFRVKCPACGSETTLEKGCPRCGKKLKENECPVCKVPARQFHTQVIDFRGSLGSICSCLGVSMPKILKGVKGLTNETKTPEIIEKGVLRAKHGLSVYKDGTIRFDATNAPLTHFRPSETGVPIERLRQLGYVSDMYGKDLTDENQMCELKIQDIIIPTRSAEYFVRVALFMDELLTKVYGLPAYYRVKNTGDLVGHLVVGLAPHTCVGVLGRIVGFTNLSLCYAHPVWHSAKRRDCDGDEDALMLALDTLLNFSRKYLPAQIGGIMDAPLLLMPVVNTREVQRQAHDLDVAAAYPREFYEKTCERIDAKHASLLIDLIERRLGTEAQFEGLNYTTPVSNINMGNPESAYKQFKTMVEKLDRQLELADKIEAVEAKRVALKVLTKHFMRDIAGNLRAFSTQTFRCKACNKRFRRLPLRGKCPWCGGQLALTVYQGGIEKYLEAAQNLIERYRLPKYYAQRIALLKEEISALFESGKRKHICLTDFV
jgi:DNA polymerase II large subunit